MGLPHEDISRLGEEQVNLQLSTGEDLKKVKEELAEATRVLAARVTALSDELKKTKTELTTFILDLSRMNADRAEEIRKLDARVSKLESKVIF